MTNRQSDLNLWSAPIIFSKIHMNVDMIWRKMITQTISHAPFKTSLDNHFHFSACFTLVHNLNLFPNVVSEILMFHIVNNWRDFLITVFDKCFWVCWNACIFSKLFQLQRVMLRAQTGSPICKVCKYRVFRPHSSQRCEWTWHVSMLRHKLLMKVAQIVV